MQPPAYDKAVKQMGDASKLTGWAELARALVRPIVTVGLVGAVVVLTATGRSSEPGFKELVTLAGVAMVFWFSSRKPSNG